jgi:hypothetical protein
MQNKESGPNRRRLRTKKDFFTDSTCFPQKMRKGAGDVLSQHNKVCVFRQIDFKKKQIWEIKPARIYPKECAAA